MEELLTHEAKNAAEYYALGAINIHQLLDICLSLEEAKIALDYADAYYLEYEVTMRRKYKRIDKINSSWETLHLQETMTWMKIGEAYGRDFLYPRPEEQFPCEERWLEDADKGHKTYTEEELQADFRTATLAKDMDVRLKAIAMANSGATLEDAYEFFKEQEYTDENQALFLRAFLSKKECERHHYEGISSAYFDNELPF